MSRITRIQIFGERGSGTGYLEGLLARNLRGVRIVWDFGWKHFFHRPGVEAADDCLFVVIYRHPFDWLQKLNRRPWHAHSTLHGLPFGEFIRREWHCVWDETAEVAPGDPRYGTEMLIERDPASGARFRNVMRMRSAKLRDWRSLQRTTVHHAYLRFEDMADDPRAIVATIADSFRLRSRWRFHEPRRPRGGGRTAYREPAEQDRAFIRAELDLPLEIAIGYPLPL